MSWRYSRKFSGEGLRQCHDSHHDSSLYFSLRLGSLYGNVYRSPKLSLCLQPSTSKKTRLKIFQAFPSYHFPSFSSCIHLRYGLTKLPCFCILSRGCEKHAMRINWLCPLECPTPERRVLVGHGSNLICCRLTKLNPTKLLNASISDNRHMASTSTSSQG